MGVVYKAKDLYLGRTVALKVLQEDLSNDEEALERFKREAQAASSLSHPNICTIHDYLIHDGYPVIVMEWLEGQTLDVCIESKSLSVTNLVEIAIQITKALKAAHSAGVIHRDIKPSNILFTETGDIKLLDFGLAKFGQIDTDPAKAATLGVKQGLTMKGSALGTVAYMSPEQALGQKVDARSDIFSLGVVFYEMWTGRIPFKGDTLAAQFNSLLNQPAPNPDLTHSVPSRQLSKITLKALNKKRQDRYQNSDELLKELKKAKQFLDSGKGNGSGGLSRISATVSTSLSKSLQSSKNIFQKKSRTTIWISLISVMLIFWLGANILLNNNSIKYKPGISLAQLDVNARTIPEGMIDFLLRKSLTHLGADISDLKVWTEDEFRILNTQSQIIYPTGNQVDKSWFGWLFETSDPRLKPEVSVSGVANEGIGFVALDLEIQKRGSNYKLVRRYGSVDEFLSPGLEELTTALLKQFRPDYQPKNPQKGYSSLPFSTDWEAIRHFFLGQDALKKLDISTAEKELKAVLLFDREFPLGRIALAELRIAQQRLEDARLELLEAARFQDKIDKIDQLRLDALHARIEKDTPEEQRILRKLIGLQPQSKERLFDLAESFFHSADADMAIVRYEQALNIDPDFALALNHLGFCYSWRGEHDKAIEILQQYVELDNTANAYDSLGQGLMAAGEYTEAQATLEMAVKMDPSQDFSKNTLGFIDIFQGKYRSAEDRINRYLSESNSRKETTVYQHSLSFLYRLTGRYTQALEMCNRGLSGYIDNSADPTYRELIWLKGLILLENGDLKAAQNQLEKLWEMVENDSVSSVFYRPVLKYAYHLKAALAAANNQKEVCLNSINDLMQIKEKMSYWGAPLERAYFLVSSAQIYENLGMEAEAEKTYRETLKYNNSYSTARFNLGRLMFEQNREMEAVSNLQKFLDGWINADTDLTEIKLANEYLQELLKKSSKRLRESELGIPEGSIWNSASSVRVREARK